MNIIIIYETFDEYWTDNFPVFVIYIYKFMFDYIFYLRRIITVIDFQNALNIIWFLAYFNLMF
jgi:hypothetical protein